MSNLKNMSFWTTSCQTRTTSCLSWQLNVLPVQLYVLPGQLHVLPWQLYVLPGQLYVLPGNFLFYHGSFMYYLDNFMPYLENFLFLPGRLHFPRSCLATLFSYLDHFMPRQAAITNLCEAKASRRNHTADSWLHQQHYWKSVGRSVYWTVARSPVFLSVCNLSILCTWTHQAQFPRRGRGCRGQGWQGTRERLPARTVFQKLFLFRKEGLHFSRVRVASTHGYFKNPRKCTLIIKVQHGIWTIYLL